MQASRRLAARLLLRQAAANLECSTSQATGVVAGLPWASNHELQQYRNNHDVRVILTQDHAKLGPAGSVVSVKSGYARHMLHPQGKAVYATPEHMRLLKATTAGRPQLTSGTRLPGGRDMQQTSSSTGQEQQLQEILTTLATKTIVARQRFSRKSPEQPVSSVGKGLISKLVASQLHIDLPPGLIMMDAPISDYGEYKVPLNLVLQPEGQQVELRVNVLKVHRS